MDSEEAAHRGRVRQIFSHGKSSDCLTVRLSPSTFTQVKVATLTSKSRAFTILEYRLVFKYDQKNELKS